MGFSRCMIPSDLASAVDEFSGGKARIVLPLRIRMVIIFNSRVARHFEP